ncbi:PucR C-terminal helix-turn-helix domain-containing protein [Agreia bicolorata]|uniref:PucR C-terminal helix-turn-helix domain-containing protein n=1 Tax=Agreia bicolorata TaxID=110935 RepID=A0A1T4Y4R4_9MICO|nr:helix-turn-helix domain-containing protein [Agreia bicolorata]SKA96311.1 PucR C-terminal helix-turn-helix domain-containing protein [Agreia bicolorata]
MQELVGRLTALDAEATETLKVISYFDALIDGRAGVDVLLRGAAVLSGCAAGFHAEGRTRRVEASGIVDTRSPGQHHRGADGVDGWPSQPFGDDGKAWIERDGAPHANDHMILERLAIALDLAVDRTSPSAVSRRAIETLIDATTTDEARIGAATRLHLDATTPYRVLASPASHGHIRPSAVIGTSAGPVRVSLCASADAPLPERAGVGVAARAHALASSWSSALIALRLTSARAPVIEADDLGGLLVLAAAADSSGPPTPDVIAVRELLRAQPQIENLLDAIAENDSLRAIALELGLHHSTVQTKVAHVTQSLGFDTHTPAGRVRLTLALALHRLATTRFD